MVPASLNAAAIRIEAEADPVGRLEKDSTCSGGAYVTGSHQSFEPIFRAMTPKDLPANVWIFVRRTGAPVQIKGISNGLQSDLAWDWSTPKDFVWCKMGPFSSASLGQRMIIIRGDEGPACAIDSVVITDEPEPDLDAFLPPLPPVPLEIDWAKPGRIITRDHFGLNCYSGLDPETAANPKYLENLIHMNPGILRIHHAGMLEDASKSPSAWVDHQKKCWHQERILAALAPLRTLPSRIIICINTWPSWMDQNQDGRLDPDCHDDYADFCADLVKIVNSPAAGKPVLWWEITNEMDDRYHKPFYEAREPDLLNELTNIYLKSAIAMKRADTRIRTGGPATTNSYNVDFHKRFIAATAPLLDFYSMHLYLTGSRDFPDAEIFERTSAPAWPLAAVRAMLDEVSPQRKIELMMDEFNINWDWRQEDVRMTDWRGAVWDAAFCLSALDAGADATSAWNERDGAYGKTTFDHQRRPAAESLHLINGILPGATVPSRISGPNTAGMRVLALLREDGRKSWVILNIGTRPRAITGVHGRATTICRKGTTSFLVEDRMTLPAISLAVIAGD